MNDTLNKIRLQAMKDRAVTYKGVNLSNSDSIDLLKVLFRTTGPLNLYTGGIHIYSDLMPFEDFCKQVAMKKLPVINGKVEAFHVFGMKVNWFTGYPTSFTVEAEKVEERPWKDDDSLAGRIARMYVAMDNYTMKYKNDEEELHEKIRSAHEDMTVNNKWKPPQLEKKNDEDKS